MVKKKVGESDRRGYNRIKACREFPDSGAIHHYVNGARGRKTQAPCHLSAHKHALGFARLQRRGSPKPRGDQFVTRRIPAAAHRQRAAIYVMQVYERDTFPPCLLSVSSSPPFLLLESLYRYMARLSCATAAARYSTVKRILKAASLGERKVRGRIADVFFIHRCRSRDFFFV